MKRLLTIMTALALALAMVAPAGAKGKPDKPPKTPVCEFDAAGTLIGYDGGEFLCAWTVTELPSMWNITVTPSGVANNLLISVRDENPGDFCAYEFVPGKSSAPVSTGDFMLPQANGDEQCPGGQFGVGDPHEFFLLVQAKVSRNNTVTVTATQTG